MPCLKENLENKNDSEKIEVNDEEPANIKTHRGNFQENWGGKGS